MKIFIGTGVKKQGINWHILVQEGEKLELLGKIFTLIILLATNKEKSIS